MSIFKAYDIRGVYPQEINEGIAERLGRAAAKYFRTTIVVGRDTRLSSDSIFDGCSECSIRYLCGGGCRGVSYLRSGVLSGSQDPSFCSAQREVYSRVNKDGEI